MTPVSHGKPCAGNPHARFEEGASAPETPRRNALLHKGICTAKKTTCRQEGWLRGDAPQKGERLSKGTSPKATRRARKRVCDRRAEARPYKGMSQTKVKSRMYASKLLTERSPVAKCVMIAEASTDAPKSFCGAPDGAGHRDMARSDSSARELGRSAAAKAGAEVGGNRSSEEAGNDRGKRVCREVHELTHSRNVLLPVETVVERVNRLLKGWGAFYSVGYPSRVFRKVNHYVLKRMARFLNRKSQRYYRLKFADTYYGEMTHYGIYRLAWADVRRTRT